MESKTLRGDRNQCQGCNEYFNSTGAFDKHRTGVFGKNRRCMTTEEMGVVGMSLNKDGFWVRKKMSEEARLSRHRNSTSVQNGEDDSTLTFGVKTPQMMDMEG